MCFLHRMKVQKEKYHLENTIAATKARKWLQADPPSVENWTEIACAAKWARWIQYGRTTDWPDLVTWVSVFSYILGFCLQEFSIIFKSKTTTQPRCDPVHIILKLRNVVTRTTEQNSYHLSFG